MLWFFSGDSHAVVDDGNRPYAQIESFHLPKRTSLRLKDRSDESFLLMDCPIRPKANDDSIAHDPFEPAEAIKTETLEALGVNQASGRLLGGVSRPGHRESPRGAAGLEGRSRSAGRDRHIRASGRDRKRRWSRSTPLDRRGIPRAFAPSRRSEGATERSARPRRDRSTESSRRVGGSPHGVRQPKILVPSYGRARDDLVVGDDVVSVNVDVRETKARPRQREHDHAEHDRRDDDGDDRVPSYPDDQTRAFASFRGHVAEVTFRSTYRSMASTTPSCATSATIATATSRSGCGAEPIAMPIPAARSKGTSL